MPLTKEQSCQVQHKVDHAGLVNQVSCLSRINALSTELQCNVETIKNFIRNHQQRNKRKAVGAPAVGSANACNLPEQIPKEPTSLELLELSEILVQKPCKLRIVASEKTSGYNLFMQKLGKELEEANKALKMEDSEAELLQMNEFQMTSDSGGQVCSRWAALSQNERDEYDAMAHSQTMANKENLDLAGKSNPEIQAVQKKSYSIMLAAIRNFVKNGGTHIGASRLPYESDNNRRITTVALGDLVEQTVRQAAKADIQYQMPKVLAYLDTKQRMDPNDKIMACPKVVGGVQARQATFQGDLLCKYQAFKPFAKKVPLKELRQGKIHSVRMTSTCRKIFDAK
ncbi:hypothetical protein HDU80_003421 [Chytriomyces hyalinus]|nr:hypothetical protein HDU80_003421 [Chytriomyces hyalinus]